MINYGILLFGIDKQPINKSTTIRSNCFYFYSYQTIECTVLSGGAVLYSSKIVGTGSDAHVVNNVGSSFADNYGYTLYVSNNNTVVELRISNEFGNTATYKFTLALDNIIDISNQHYVDMLVNKGLPNFDTIKSSFAEDFDASMFISRMLLDYNSLMSGLGTKASIYKFLQLIGYDTNQVSVHDEYLTLTEQTTLLPNVLTDKKTGNYHILYDNYEDEGLDDNNLPIRTIVINDLSAFKASLISAIAIANTYFTVLEQNITFFGLMYSSNIAIEPSITSHSNSIFESDTLYFRKKLHINMHTHRDTDSITEQIKDCIQLTDMLYRTELKIIDTSIPTTPTTIYSVDSEVYDDMLNVNPDIQYTYKTFGVCLHLDIIAPGLYVEYSVTDLVTGTSYTNHKRLIDSHVTDTIVLLTNSRYMVSVFAFDSHNNREAYYYTLNTEVSSQYIDFELFSSGAGLSIDNKYKYNVNLDVESSAPVSVQTNNYILPITAVLDDLSLYYSVVAPDMKFLTSPVERYILPDLSQNIAIRDVTESISIGMLDAWLDIVTFQYDPALTLMLRFDTDIVPVGAITDYNPTFDCLYVGLIDVYDPLSDSEQAYYLIFTTEPGVNIEINTYDFVLVDSVGTVTSIYPIVLNQKKIPANYDFPLFHIVSKLYPTFVGYISPTEHTEIIDGVEYPMVKSLFPMLTEVGDATGDTYNMKIGDVVMARIDSNLVVGEINIRWQVYDYFSKKLIHASTDLTLKFRIPDRSIYDVICSFVIDGEDTKITKIGAFSSFNSETYI